ncbi:MAG: carboxypeptidase regulatory-like domain-containing protein [Planctomycetes bacterium]|nr:carboxypeptidase regulatory-like domain-containing protein [Planctomycetota bacterium]
MNRNLLGIFVLLAALALALGWWFTRGTRAPTTLPHAADTQPATDSAAPPAADATLAVVPERTTAVRDSAATVVETEATEAAPAAGEPWRVLVVDRQTRAPVAGAELRWSNRVEHSATFDRSRPFFAADLESLMPPDAARGVTNEQGEAQLAASALPGLVSARAGTSFGASYVFDRTTQPTVIHIAREINLTLQVVDAVGRPVAGVPVAVRLAGQEQRVGGWTGMTAGADGLVHARHIEQRVFGEPPFALVALLPIPLRQPVTVPIDIDALPTDPIRLVLPPCGSVLVQVHDSEGGPVLPIGLNMVEQKHLGPDGSLGWTTDSFEPALIELGRALYPFVEIGLDLYVDAMTLGQVAHTTGPGPRVVGEQVVFDLDLGSSVPRLVGTLVDLKREPVANATLSYVLNLRSKGGSTNAQLTTTTDARGRFDIPLVKSDTTDLAGTITFKPLTLEPSAGSAVSVELEGRVQRGVNDLGVIMLSAPVHLVSGRVVDENGVPLKRISIEIQALATGSRGPTWVQDSSLSARSDDGGNFAVTGPARNGRLRLRAFAPDSIQPDVCEVAVGASDVTIVLSKSSQISGRVLFDADVDHSRLIIELRRAADSPEAKLAARGFEQTHVRADGAFELRGVRPLVTDLIVRVPGVKEPIAMVQNLDLRGGGPATDPRLAAIDLRGLVPPAPVTPATKR